MNTAQLIEAAEDYRWELCPKDYRRWRMAGHEGECKPEEKGSDE